MKLTQTVDEIRSGRVNKNNDKAIIMKTKVRFYRRMVLRGRVCVVAYIFLATTFFMGGEGEVGTFSPTGGMIDFFWENGFGLSLLRNKLN